MPPDQFGRYPHEGGYYRTYTNALFVNKTILVPVYEAQYDTTALRIWEELMPGYRVVGIDCNEIIPASGAIHCITKEVGVEQPLLVTHMQPRTVDAGQLVPLQVEAKHISGIKEVALYMKNPGSDVFVEFEIEPDTSDNWVADIALEEPGEYQYYFHAVPNSGKEIVRPIVAPEGAFQLTVSDPVTSMTGKNGNFEEITFFPNPAREYFTIKASSKTPKAMSARHLRIHDFS